MKRRTTRGYTFVEVLVASGIVGMAIGGAVRLVATMQVHEEAANDVAVALNLQDNAARLWQLGLTPTEVNNILPITTNNNDLAGSIVPYGTNSVSFGTAGTTTLANSMGTLENITCDVTIPNLGGGANRTSTVQTNRPSIR